MSSCEVRLWGSAIGAVNWDARTSCAGFAFTEPFQASGIEVAPIKMPLKAGVYRFPELARTSFQGLPGLLADALPDRFGNAVIDAWLATHGRAAGELNPVERLAYTGSRGMGALEFYPAMDRGAGPDERLEMSALVELSTEVLSQREGFRARLEDGAKQQALASLLSVGTSAGGARAKAVVAWNPATDELRSGQTETPPGFEHWLIKFDGVEGNRDKELADPQGFGVVEFAYHLMACEAGIQMSDCRVLEENGRKHFMTRRFDRIARAPSGKEHELRYEKLHLCSLAGLMHLDYNLAGAHSYEGAFDLLDALEQPMAAREELYRRMLFNVLARNQDDHVKNIAFTMDKAGSWSLSPAFDLTFAFNPDGTWTHQHQMSIQGKRDHFEEADLLAVAEYAGLARGRGPSILDQVRAALERWPELAQQAGLDEEWSASIGAQLRP